jgi:hypothetical protein
VLDELVDEEDEQEMEEDDYYQVCEDWLRTEAVLWARSTNSCTCLRAGWGHPCKPMCRGRTVHRPLC